MNSFNIQLIETGNDLTIQLGTKGSVYGFTTKLHCIQGEKEQPTIGKLIFAYYKMCFKLDSGYSKKIECN